MFYRCQTFMVAFFDTVLFPSQSCSISFSVLPLVSTLPYSTSFIPSLLSKTIRSLSLCREMGSGRLGCCVHLLQLWFCSHLNVIFRAQPVGFFRKNRVKLTVALDLPFIGDTTSWLLYLFGLGPINWIESQVGSYVGPIVLVCLASLWWASGVKQGTFQVWL